MLISQKFVKCGGDKDELGFGDPRLMDKCLLALAFPFEHVNQTFRGRGAFAAMAFPRNVVFAQKVPLVVSGGEKGMQTGRLRIEPVF
jgi:hypothetical protein